MRGRRQPSIRLGSVDLVVGLTYFDAILAEHVESSLKEAFRVLKPGGRLVHLQDFPDWPGPELARRLDALVRRARPGEYVRFNKRRNRLEYRLPEPAEAGSLLTELGRLRKASEGFWVDAIDFMIEVYSDPEGRAKATATRGRPSIGYSGSP